MRFHFHTQDGRRHRDHDGLELPSTDAAKTEAAKALAQMLEEYPDSFWADGAFHMIVTDDSGSPLFTLQLTADLSPPADRRR